MGTTETRRIEDSAPHPAHQEHQARGGVCAQAQVHIRDQQLLPITALVPALAPLKSGATTSHTLRYTVSHCSHCSHVPLTVSGPTSSCVCQLGSIFCGQLKGITEPWVAQLQVCKWARCRGPAAVIPHTPSMPLHRRLYRSILQQIHQFRKDGIPLVGLAGAGSDPMLQQVPSVQGQDVVGHVRAAFREPAANVTTQHGFAVLRALSEQHHTLISVEDHTKEALRTWQQFIRHTCTSHHQPNAAASMTPNHQATLSSINSPAQLAAGIEAAIPVVQQLYQDTQLEGLEDEESWPVLQEPSVSSDGQVSLYHSQVVAALNADEGGRLSTALDTMAAHVSSLHPGLFHSSGDQHASGTNSMQGMMQQEQQQAIISAVQQYLYGSLKLRHEPIEWLYDGIKPLLPGPALKQRKAAPFTLALIACMLASKLGVPCMPLRGHPSHHSSPAAHTHSSPPPELPDALALHLSKRAAPFIASDSWLLAVVHPSQVSSSPGQPQQAVPASTWVPGHVFLDVSSRGGLLMTGADQLTKRYPEALSQGAIPPDAGSHLVHICAEWVRAVMVAHQRRGESDLVAHWLVQVLALNPYAPEWELMRAS